VPLYTRQGDDGETGLLGGHRVRKDDPRVEAYGSVDELNALLGLAISHAAEQDGTETVGLIRSRLTCVQGELFCIGATLASLANTKQPLPGGAISHTQVDRIEQWIDEASRPVAALRSFVLPGGNGLAARLHVCRTVCRRAERRTVAIESAKQADLDAVRYLNRLGDLLFAWARLANHAAGVADVEWNASEEA